MSERFFPKSLAEYKQEAKKIAKPLVLSTLLYLSPGLDIQSNNINTPFDIATKVEAAEKIKAPEKILFDSLKAEYPRMYSNKINPDYKSQIVEDTQYGLGKIATDEYTITHKYNEELGKWEKLAENLPYQTPEIRIKKLLYNLINHTEKITLLNGEVVYENNPLNLNIDDVYKYIATNSDKGLESFKIIKNAKGEPAIILATSEKFGMTKEITEVILKNFKRINAIDPGLVDKLTHQFYLRAICGDSPINEMRQKMQLSALYYSIGAIRYNSNHQALHNRPQRYLAVLLSSSKTIHNYKSQRKVGENYERFYSEKQDDNMYVDRVKWAENWFKKYSSSFTQEELTESKDFLGILMQISQNKQNPR